MSSQAAPQLALSPGETYPHQVAALIETGRQFHEMKWSLATSSNYSIRVSDAPLLLMTASGKDKGRLQSDDFVLVGPDGKLVSDQGNLRPSAETQLHISAISMFNAGCVLHTHSVYAAVLSERFASQGEISFTGYEMQKGIEGVTTHDTTLTLPIFDNDQDIVALRKRVEARLTPSFASHGYLIRKHGLYAWGTDLNAARRHVEALEFLLEATARALAVKE